MTARFFCPSLFSSSDARCQRNLPSHPPTWTDCMQGRGPFGFFVLRRVSCVLAMWPPCFVNDYKSVFAMQDGVHTVTSRYAVPPVAGRGKSYSQLPGHSLWAYTPPNCLLARGRLERYLYTFIKIPRPEVLYLGWDTLDGLHLIHALGSPIEVLKKPNTGLAHLHNKVLATTMQCSQTEET